MKLTDSFTIITIMVWALMSGSVALAADAALTTEEVTALISGKTVHGTSSKGKRYRMYFADDGSLKSGDKATGTWEVRDGAVCNTWDHRGPAGCDKVYRRDNGKIYYITPSGGKGKFLKFEDGDQL